MSSVWHTDIGNDIKRAANHLKAGEAVAIATETVYGLAANALDAKAVAHVFEIKNRPHFDPLIVHVPARHGEQTFDAWCERVLGRYVESVPAWAYALANAFWPGPLTLVLKRRDCIPDLVTSGLPTVGIRVPSHAQAQALLSLLSFPLAAPSANPFGYVSPTCAEHVIAQLDGKIPYVLDGGACGVGIESTIVGELDGVPTILRLGGLSQEDIERVVGPVGVQQTSSSQPLNPGALESHYAPLRPLYLDHATVPYAPDEVGLLRFDTLDAVVPVDHQRVLSPSRDLNEAARNLFAFVRELDALPGLRCIVAERLPQVGLGRAINDRLQRAASPRK